MKKTLYNRILNYEASKVKESSELLIDQNLRFFYTWDNILGDSKTIKISYELAKKLINILKIRSVK